MPIKDFSKIFPGGFPSEVKSWATNVPAAPCMNGRHWEIEIGVGSFHFLFHFHFFTLESDGANKCASRPLYGGSHWEIEIGARLPLVN